MSTIRILHIQNILKSSMENKYKVLKVSSLIKIYSFPAKVWNLEVWNSGHYDKNRIPKE